ncbi:MAG: glycoside hydrolase family 97 C-terminal domain-containing protein, partial [Verrucomicrobiota bacterium]|nr:glycoside hydrolase family 97 C-terminal domain-containing protein [Verrucomicrobiota bacterium]
VWDDTRVLHGEIGAYAVIARRSGQTWYVGAINAETERECRLTLDFLEPDTTYLATLYQHDPDSSSPTKVGIRTQAVTHATIIDLQLPTNDGAAIHITPVESAAASLGLTPK